MIAYRGIPRWGLMAAIAMAVLGLMAVGMAISDDSSADIIGNYETESTGPMKAPAPTATVFDDAGLGYAVQSDGTLMLVSVPTDAVNVVVPATVDDNGVARNVSRLFSGGANGPTAFSNHTKVASIDFKNRSVGAYDLMYQFCGCSGLTSVTLPDTWTKVSSAYDLFCGCSGLTSVTLPDTWKIVLESSYGFYGCGALKQITLTTLPTEIGADALYGTPTPIYVFGLTSEQISAMNALAGVSSEKFAAAPIVSFNANGGDAIAPVQGLTVTLPTDATRAPTEDTTYKLAYFEAADGTQYKPGETVDLTQTGDLNLTVRWYATTTGGYNGPGAGTVDKLIDALPVIVIAGIVAAVAIGMMIVGRNDRNLL